MASFATKFINAMFVVQFVSAFSKERQKLRGGVLSEEELEFATQEILACSTYKKLVADGKTAQEINEILDITHMTPKRFRLLTGKEWPNSNQHH